MPWRNGWRNTLMKLQSRRRVLQGLGAGGVAALFGTSPAVGQSARPRVVVIGGGIAGASVSRALRREDPTISVTLVEPSARYTTCPFSNLVVAGLREIATLQFGYDGLRRAGIDVMHESAVAVDSDARRVRLRDGVEFTYDRLVVAPGVDLRWDAIPGYSESAASTMPHAWKAGEQTILLRRQLEAMDDGGVVIMSVPANPFRCPPGPYERASLIAHYLKTRKPRSKLIVLDAKDQFSKQRLFTAAWKALYPETLEWISLSDGGRVREIDPSTKTLVTEFGSHRADVASIIPPQRAGSIAGVIGVADQTGWCPIDPVTFESRLVPNIHVIGDAAIGGAMPKSAFTANAQAKACASAIVQLLRGADPAAPKLINTCYSLVAPDYAISIAGVYTPRNGLLAEVDGAGGTSPIDASAATRAAEATYAESWYQAMTREVFVR